jgi:histidinol phosphate aminotransferase apoenzyme (EC 2.6.1.9)
MRAELNDNLRLYPDPNSDRLKQTVAEYYGVTPAQVFVGNGSDEVLAHIFHGLFQHDSRPAAVPGCQLQLLSGLLRPVRHSIRAGGAG